MITYKICF